MEDVHGFQSKSYVKAEKMPELTIIQNIQLYFGTVPLIILKTIFIFIIAVFYLVRWIFYLIVPKPMKNIRGQLAAVSFDI